MPLPAGLLTTTCDIYHPFGAGSPTQTGVACRISPAPLGTMMPDEPSWSHTLDCQPGVEVCDMTTRTTDSASREFADGDEVRVPSGGSTRYVVVWVEVVARGTPLQFLRAYLLRHEPSWPDP